MILDSINQHFQSFNRLNSANLILKIAQLANHKQCLVATHSFYILSNFFISQFSRKRNLKLLAEDLQITADVEYVRTKVGTLGFEVVFVEYWRQVVFAYQDVTNK